MIPILMQDETTVGFLKEAMSCVVTEERNGVFELSLTYPVTGALFDKLQIDRFVKAKPNDTANLQLFRIYEVTKPMNGVVTVNAEHVSYALSNFPVEDIRITGTATQAILNSRRYGHEGTYLPMRVIDRGALTGFISMNRSWAGFDYEDYYRASQIAMGLLDEELDANLEKEYLPEGGHRIGGLVDDHGIAQIARELTAAEQAIKDKLEGKTPGETESSGSKTTDRAFQVVSGSMFSRVHEPVLRISTCNLLFSVSCVSRLPGAEAVELLFNPVERIGATGR